MTINYTNTGSNLTNPSNELLTGFLCKQNIRMESCGFLKERNLELRQPCHYAVSFSLPIPHAVNVSAELCLQ